MKGEDKLLIKLMDGSDNRFIIPVYQRNYDWKEPQCKQLFKDLIDVAKTGRKSHFFGGIVRSRVSGGRADDYLIIDGQQRLTTITLLLLAIYNNILDGFVVPTDNTLQKKIWNKYIVDEYQKDQRKIRLKLIKSDCEAFDCLIFKGKEDYIRTSNVTANYLYFYTKIKELPVCVSIDSLYEAINKLLVIDIFLDHDDDPQLIFESLNSTGLDLTEADKIRNYILMGLEITKQESYYELYWNKIEENTSYEVSTFIRDYLTLKTGKISSIDKVYFSFKEYVQNGSMSIEEILKDILIYSKIYRNISKSDTHNKQIDSLLKRLNQLDMTVTYPYLFALFRYAEEQQLDINEISNVLSTIETYIFRRLICGVPTNALNKIFASLHKDVIRKKNNDDRYSDVMIFQLQSKSGSGSFPNDEEFKQSFITKNIYSMQSKNKLYIFERLENGNSKETHDIISLMQDGQLSIEHIMPQTLNESWKKELGAEFDRIHSEWLNTIANLTLTGYNSRYSNRPFIEKRDIENGFKDSSLRLNKYLEKCDRWTELELKTRRDELLAYAMQLWQYPQTNFIPTIKEDEIVSLADDFDFKGRGISAFILMGTTYKIIDWADASVEIIKLICELDAIKIYQEAINPDNVWISSTKQNNSYKYIIDNIYLCTNSNTNTKINIIRGLFNHIGIEESELDFVLTPLKQED